MNTISAVIITLNEEKNIGRCLESLSGIVDETIVLDSYSTDKTKEICLKHAVTFHEKEWEGYSKSKNFANSLSTSDYILSIDADESLSPELATSLLNIKGNSNPKSNYHLNRLTNYCGKWIKHGGWYPDRKLRLWKKDTAQWEGDIHEHLKINDTNTTGHLRGDLFHYTFHSFSQHLAQINKFTDIAAKDDFERGRKTNLVKILIFPKWKFIRDYFVKRGFQDGYYGFLVCKFSAQASFLKYVKLWELQKGQSKRS